MSNIEELWNGKEAAHIRERFRRASDGLMESDSIKCAYCGAVLPAIDCIKCPECGQLTCEE